MNFYTFYIFAIESKFLAFHLFSAILAKDWESLFLKFCPEMTGSFDKKLIETEVLWYGTQVYICGFAGGGTGKSDCGMVSPPAWIFAPYYYGLNDTEDGIFRNGVRAWTSQAVHAGDVIETHLVETEPSDGILPRPVPFSVVYEDDDILVVDKPADTPIHPSIGNYENTLANGIAWYFEQKGEPFVYRCINRLDRDTTGLIVLAKHALSAAVLSQAMRSREIHRTYQPSPSAKPLHPAPSTPRSPASTAPSSSAPSTLPPASAP